LPSDCFPLFDFFFLQHNGLGSFLRFRLGRDVAGASAAAAFFEAGGSIVAAAATEGFTIRWGAPDFDRFISAAFSSDASDGFACTSCPKLMLKIGTCHHNGRV
jgi:hypothetical protein